MKTAQKLIILLLALIMSAAAVAEEVYDFDVNGIYYKILENGNEVSVTYRNYSYSSHTAYYESDYTGDVVIPETETINGESYRVRYIGSEAFYGCVNLTSVTLPSTIVNIGYHSFANCHILEYIELPEGMQQINSNAFSYCEELDYIFIHSTEPFYLWDDAFADINDHVQIVVPCNCIEAFEAAE